MILSVPIMLAVAAAPSFAVQSVPIDNIDAEVLFVAVDADDVPEAMILDNQSVRIFSGDAENPGAALQLPDGTSAVDVFDIDSDGQAELLAVHGAELLAFELAPLGPPTELFRVETPLAEPRPQPFPYVMALEWEDRVAIALPRKTAIELRTLAGAPVTSFPMQGPDALGVDYGRPLSIRNVDPPQAGGSNTLELRVSMIRDVAPELPESLLPPQSLSAGRPGTLSHAREATLGDPANWPWFPLQKRGDEADRVLYALEPPEFRNTLIRIRRAASDAQGAADEETYRYPGALVPYGDQSLPDFNGDGFVDLFLWKAPVPGGSVDALARAATGGAWPLTTTIHQYNPQKGKYEPRPSSPIKHQVNVPWFMTTEQGSPLRHILFEDFNGDGKSDFGCSTGPKTFAIWYYRNGFIQGPDFQHEFSAPLTDLEAVYASPDAKVSILLFRSPHTIHIVRGTR